MEFLVNLLFAVLAFFVVRYIGNMVAPEGSDKDKIVTIIAVIVAVVVFLANYGARVIS